MNTSDRYFKLKYNSVIPKNIFNINKFSFITIIPTKTDFDDLGIVLKSIIDVHQNVSFENHLIIWMNDNQNKENVSSLKVIWNYLLKSSSNVNLNNTFLFEVCFNKNMFWSKRIKAVFDILYYLDFDYAMFYTLSNTSMPNSSKLKLFYENTLLSKIDLNLASYTIPYYKGMMINFWLTPLSYLFGRQIRNPAAPDFIFSRNCLNAWLDLDWPKCEYRTSTYLFLIISSYTFGIRINEFFLGEKEFQILYLHEKIPEIIKTGLYLVSKYKNFIQRSSSILPSTNLKNSKIPFKIYRASDLNKILSIYDSCDLSFTRKFTSFIRKYLNESQYKIVKSEITKLPLKSISFEEYRDSWNNILLCLLQAYSSNKSKEKRSKILKIFVQLFSIKTKLWSDQIKKMIKTTHKQALNDQKRGFPWIGGEDGKNWHIHDWVEKNIHKDLTKMYAMKNRYF